MAIGYYESLDQMFPRGFKLSADNDTTVNPLDYFVGWINKGYNFFIFDGVDIVKGEKYHHKKHFFAQRNYTPKDN